MSTIFTAFCVFLKYFTANIHNMHGEYPQFTSGLSTIYQKNKTPASYLVLRGFYLLSNQGGKTS